MKPLFESCQLMQRVVCRLPKHSSIAFTANLPAGVLHISSIAFSAQMQVFLDLDFSLIEMNPFTLDAQGQPFPLDMRGELDDTAAFRSAKKWLNVDFPLPFGRNLTGNEEYVKTLDDATGDYAHTADPCGVLVSTSYLADKQERSMSARNSFHNANPVKYWRCIDMRHQGQHPDGRVCAGASLKLSILNPRGRIWTMVAGGGASVIYADTVADLGLAHVLAFPS